jgi:hypothetical protein
MPIVSAFDNYPKEAALVGRILAEYGELEFELCALLSAVFNNPNVGVRALFRTKGENTRIQVADAFLRPAHITAGLKNEYEAMLGAIRWSKTCRNQYAHAHWTPINPLGGKGLFFADLDSTAKTSEGDALIQLKRIDATLLESQEKYMNYTSEWLWYLESEYRVRVKRLTSHDHVAPRIIEPPPLHSPL